MHVVDHVEGQGGKNENVETQCKYREQKKLELIWAGIQISGGILHLTWVFKSLALLCYCSTTLVWEKEERGPQQVWVLLCYPHTQQAPRQRPRAGNPAAHVSRHNTLLLQISGAWLCRSGPACVAPVSVLAWFAGGTSWNRGQSLLFAKECVWTQHRRWATPADLPWTSSVLGAGLNQPAKAAAHPQLGPEPVWGLLSPVSF